MVDDFIASELVRVNANLLVGRMTRPLSTIRNTTCIRQMSTRYPPPPRKISVVTHKPPRCLYGAPSSPTRHAVALWPHRNSIQFALRPRNMQNVMNAMVCYDPILTYKRPHLIRFSSAGDYGLPTADNPSSSIGGCLCIADRTKAARQNGDMQNG